MRNQNKQPFEQYPELSELILYAATNWKVNYKWSQTLGAINKVCAELTELRNASQHIYTEQKISGNWDEDKGHENGNYNCVCCKCGNTFIGHKRRVVCKICHTPPTYTQEQMIAFGERVLKEAAEQAKQIWDHNNYWGSKPIINKQSILSIDISKLLNK